VGGRDALQRRAGWPAQDLRIAVLHVTCLTKFPHRKAEHAKRRLVELQGIHRHNLHGVMRAFRWALLTAVTGISAPGKSSLIAQALPECGVLTWATSLKTMPPKAPPAKGGHWSKPTGGHSGGRRGTPLQRLRAGGAEAIGRTPAVEPGYLHGSVDHVRKLFAARPDARRPRY